MSEPNFAELRSLLQKTQDAQTWSDICALLEQWPSDFLQEQALPYTLKYLEDWEDFWRVAPRGWVERAMLGAKFLYFEIVRAVDIQSRQFRTYQIAKLAHSSLFEHVSELYCSRTLFDAERLTVLFSGHLGSKIELKTLLLDRSEVSDRGFSVLMGWKNIHQVRHLGLEQCYLSATSMQLLAKTAPQNLKILDFGGNPFDERAIELLARSQLTEQLEELCLDWCKAKYRLIKPLCSQLDWLKLKVLDLSGSELTHIELKILAKWPAIANLRDLKLRWSVFSEKDLLEFVQSAPIENLQTLDISPFKLSEIALDLCKEIAPNLKIICAK